MKRLSSILVIAVILIAATLTMMYGNGRTQNTNKPRSATRTAETAGTDVATTENIRTGKAQVRLLPRGAGGVELKAGVLRVKPGYKFEMKDDGTVSVARINGGVGVGGGWSCGCGSSAGGTCVAKIVLGTLSCHNGTCNDCFLDVTVNKVRTNIIRY